MHRARLPIQILTAVSTTSLLFPDTRHFLETRANGVVRFSRSVIAATAATFYYQKLARTVDAESAEYAIKQAEVHKKAAEWMLYVCRENGGIYNKLGQYISTMNHVLPAEFTSTLSVVQDKAQTKEFHEIARVIETEFDGQPIHTLFRRFETKPIAAASLAQVHCAETFDGRRVAVKVQYPDLESQVIADMRTLNFLMRALAYFFPEMEFTWVIPDFAQNLQYELDFTQEGLNAARLAHMLHPGNSSTGLEDSKINKNRVHIPTVYWDLSKRRVLTMEFIEGVKVTDKHALRALGINPAQVADIVTRVFAEMVHVHGFVHIDPHPGNLMVRRKPSASSLPIRTKEKDDSNQDGVRFALHQFSISDDAILKKPQPIFDSINQWTQEIGKTSQMMLYVGALIPVLSVLGIGASTAAIIKECRAVWHSLTAPPAETEMEKKERLRKQMLEREEYEKEHREKNKRRQIVTKPKETEIVKSTSVTNDDSHAHTIQLDHPIPLNNDWELVILDHGMYRRFDPRFRRAYCLLWKAMLCRNVNDGFTALAAMDIPEDARMIYYEIISLLLTFKPSFSRTGTGGRMSKEDRDKIRQFFYDNPLDAGDLTGFLKALPRDMLFAMRSTAIIRSINQQLEGTTANRLAVTAKAAVRGLHVPPMTSHLTELDHATVTQDTLANTKVQKLVRSIASSSSSSPTTSTSQIILPVVSLQDIHGNESMDSKSSMNSDSKLMVDITKTSRNSNSDLMVDIPETSRNSNNKPIVDITGTSMNSNNSELMVDITGTSMNCATDSEMLQIPSMKRYFDPSTDSVVPSNSWSSWWNLKSDQFGANWRVALVDVAFKSLMWALSFRKSEQHENRLKPPDESHEKKEWG